MGAARRASPRQFYHEYMTGVCVYEVRVRLEKLVGEDLDIVSKAWGGNNFICRSWARFQVNQDHGSGVRFLTTIMRREKEKPAVNLKK